MAGLLLAAALAGAGCGSKAGMSCQQQADCRAGLICSKPPGASAYGVCEPARRGLGESCLRTSECQTGLRCSTERGQVGGDGWFGLCEPGGASDLAGTADLAAADLAPADLSPVDGGPDM